MHLFVGSTNPVKINAVITAASETYPNVVVKGYSVESGIPEQPVTDEQTRLGAQNRAKNALQAGLTELKLKEKNKALGIGLEGGVFTNEHDEMWSTVWVVVTDEQGKTWDSNGARFQVPLLIADRIRKGGEMGPIMSDLFQGENIKHNQGMIGVITNNFIDRTEEYVGIAKMALGLWYGREWEKQLGVRD